MDQQILVVGDHLDTNSNVFLPTTAMKTLNLNDGDTVIATKTIETVCTVASQDSDECLHLSVDVRNSLAAQLDDRVAVKPCHVEDGELVVVVPNADSAVGLTKR